MEAQHKKISADEQAFDQEFLEQQLLFRDRLPELVAELLDTRRDLARAEAFREEVGLALEELQGIAKDTYRIWSKALNPRIKELAQKLLPDVTGFQFQPDLSYRVDLSGGQSLKDQELVGLSRGARAQLLLSLRLGMAEYLSAAAPDQALPLLLDDPFVHFDDDRHATAMKLLLEKAKQGAQIFLFTCHRARYEALQAELGKEELNLIHAIEPIKAEEQLSAETPS